jgi:diadenosine tetraphosphate (Ap4A) HIT family hydrolase
MTGTERLALLAEGNSPLLIERMPSGFAVMGDSQFLPGYALLLAYPEANHLTDLTHSARSQYLLDMSLLGEAVMQATNCLRVNYAIYGNLDPFLHAHVWPRYTWEDEEYRLRPPFSYPPEYRDPELHGYSEHKHGNLKLAIAQHLLTLSGGDTTP